MSFETQIPVRGHLGTVEDAVVGADGDYSDEYYPMFVAEVCPMDGGVKS